MYIAFYFMSSLLWHFFLSLKNEHEIRVDPSDIKNPPHHFARARI